MPQQTVCPSCAEPLEPEDAYCGSCGASLTGAAPAAAQAGGGTGCVRCGGAEVVDGYCTECGVAQPRPRDHQERSLAGVAAVTDRGLRHHRNEDAFTVAGTTLPGGEPAVIAVVCDGVSSSPRPDDASAAAAEAAAGALLGDLTAGREPDAAMRTAIVTAHQAVTALARQGRSATAAANSPACTYVSAIHAAGLVTIGWIGDTRAYWIPDDRESAEPYRLTEDDSWAARVVAAGLMPEAEAYADPRAHAITGWLGADAEELDPHTISFTPHVPGVLLICTDGLWNYAAAATDLALLVPKNARTDPLAAARALVNFAVASGGQDNITVAVLPITPEPAEEAQPTVALLDVPLPRRENPILDLPTLPLTPVPTD